MKSILFFFCLFLLLPATSFCWVKCENVQINKIESATESYFHGLNNAGVTGSVLFVSIPSSLCSAANGEELSSTIFLVIDDYDNGGSLKKFWSSLLLLARTSGKSIRFHANYGGVSGIGYSVLLPYYLGLN